MIDLDCIFCSLVSSKDRDIVIDEDAHTVSFMHLNPATRGHALVIPRCHAEDLYAIDPEDLAQTMCAAQRLALKVRDRLDADGVNLINACRPAAWQTVFHFHVHVVPRYVGDPLELPWTPAPGDEDEIKAGAAALRG